ncbi:hypothetical protein TNCV_2505481 [Trichonephila clavipes]|uniref:Uncharacterized protein n=1 Tax=Trichonephila clavipes TaxID=2585209 RepID=A0A8X7BK73_TRICX|nr:hypothetical protein TNCV_2505481 [Trichonephila clavipes]
MSRSDGQSEVRPPVFKSPNKLGTHFSTHYRFLRRNRRQYEQLTVFDRGRLNRPQRSSGSQKVECTVAEGQDVPGTQMIARIVQSEEGHFGTNNVASIDSTPLTFQTSSAIKRNHKETTDHWLEEPTSAKTLATTDPTS